MAQGFSQKPGLYMKKCFLLLITFHYLINLKFLEELAMYLKDVVTMYLYKCIDIYIYIIQNDKSNKSNHNNLYTD